MRIKSLGIGILIYLAFSNVTLAFLDVPNAHENFTSTSYLEEKGIIHGYDDGSFRPGNRINRAEFMKIVIEGITEGAVPEATENCFSDVDKSVWYAKYVCEAKTKGIISGYSDGTFRPGTTINLAEALKVIVKAYGIEVDQVIEGEPWYQVYLNAMGGTHYIPTSLIYLNQDLKRAEMAEMIWRVLEKKSDLSYKSADDLKSMFCVTLGEDLPKNVDMDRVREAWVSWNNEVRVGLGPYGLNEDLNRSAVDWAKEIRDKKTADHKRTGTSAYYDYVEITEWFADLGLVFKNVNRATHTENIGWGYYKCSEADCTDYMIERIRSTFDFFYGEKDKPGDKSHYNSIMKAEFQIIGVGVALDEADSKYYIAIHYGTEIISNPPDMCQ